MARESMAEAEPRRVIVGVDTHKDVHVASAKDELGRGLGQMTIPASTKGYRALLAWSRELGQVQAFGVEGTGCYGAGLARHLRREGEVVIEVIRPNRQARRRRVGVGVGGESRVPLTSRLGPRRARGRRPFRQRRGPIVFGGERCCHGLALWPGRDEDHEAIVPSGRVRCS